MIFNLNLLNFAISPIHVHVYKLIIRLGKMYDNFVSTQTEQHYVHLSKIRSEFYLSMYLFPLLCTCIHTCYHTSMEKESFTSILFTQYHIWYPCELKLSDITGNCNMWWLLCCAVQVVPSGGYWKLSQWTCIFAAPFPQIMRLRGKH